MVKNISRNVIHGDNAGNNINKNYYNFLHLPPSLDMFHEEINKKVNELLPNGLFSIAQNKIVDFNSNELFDSLMHIAMPSKVALEILSQIPDNISALNDDILNNFSSSHVREIIYRILQNLDYEIFGDKVEIWGQSYIRKYGNPDKEMEVFLEVEDQIKPLNYEFLYKILVPDIYRKCYARDIDEDLGFIKSKTIKSDMASEILEKIRILNLYLIRYGTLKKLAYDLAIHPPHPWFSERSNTERDLNYHQERYLIHYGRFINGEALIRSAKEFIDHSCAAILSRYNLVIGLGRNRPLITLMNHLKLSKENLLYWQSLDISNIAGDTASSHYSLNKFKGVLENIRVKLYDPEKNYEALKNCFECVFKIANLIIEKRSELLNLSYGSSVDSIESLKSNSFKLLSIYDKMALGKDYLKFSFESSQFQDIRPYIHLGFFFNEEFDLPILGPNSNTVLIISSSTKSQESIGELINEKISNADFVFVIDYDELRAVSFEVNRRDKLEKMLHDGLI